MSALLVRTFPSMNFNTARMLQRIPLKMETLNRKSSCKRKFQISTVHLLLEQIISNPLALEISFVPSTSSQSGMLPPGGGILHAFTSQLCVTRSWKRCSKTDNPNLYLLRKPLCIYFPIGNSPSHYSAKMSSSHRSITELVRMLRIVSSK